MPFVVRDPWRVQYFENVPCPDDVVVAVDDLDCWEFYPNLRFIYDKLFIAQSQGLPSGTHVDWPQRFPVFAKPRVNLKGMGLGSFIIHDEAAFRARMADGQMWMQHLSGPHVSTDCAVVKGKVAWLRHATGVPWTDGMFKHWTIEAADNPALSEFIADWIARVLPNYTGMINIETIDGRIIEAQIRFADQWCDLNGTGWLEAVAGLYTTGQWLFDEPTRRDGYSVPLFIRHGKVPKHPSRQVQENIRAMQGISSLQITFFEEKSGKAHTMPPGGFRLAVINATDFAAGIAARAELAKAFEGFDVMLP
jgi:hypothetical protein